MAAVATAAEELLPPPILLAVLSRVEPADCCRAACVNRLWRSLASDDFLWQHHCRARFAVHDPMDPSGNPCSTFKEAYSAWWREFGACSDGLVYRTRKCWDDLRTYLRAAYPQIADSLSSQASEADIAEAERSLGWTLPHPVRLLYRFCNGQDVSELCNDNLGYVGLLGGYYFYRHFVNVQLLPLKQAVRLTHRLLQLLPDDVSARRMVIAASCNLNKFFFLDCTDGMVYVGTKLTLEGGLMLPCVPPASSSVAADGMLRWLEEYRRRLLAGEYAIRSDEGVQSISLFPESPPLCTQAVTRGVQVRCSAVFVPELSTMVDEGEKYLFAYSVRMRLLPDGCGGGCTRCQLSRRHWIIKSDGVVTANVRGEAVVGIYPLLEAGGDVFVYESCSDQVGTSGSIEGDFTFLPGSLAKPEGPDFLVRVAPFPLQLPQYIY